jgi:hypothetical protein
VAPTFEPKNWDGGWLELLTTIEKGRGTRSPDRKCRILFSDLVVKSDACNRIAPRRDDGLQPEPAVAAGLTRKS